MTNQNNSHNPSNFWFGFALGVSGAAGIAYLLGTKKGRDLLKYALEQIEHMQDNPDELLTILQTLGNIAKREGEVFVPEAHRSSLDMLMDKVKNITREAKTKETFLKQK